ncbi:dioxygenase [Paenibacillus sp. sptzw28]|nr:dioxygenase [Paenibacillus sp. sptzw28]
MAEQVADRFRANSIDVLMSDRGLDHGTWVPLSRMFPKADIPVVQLSVHPFLPAERQFRIGEALRGLGHENILVVGSGVTVHNLQRIEWGLSRDRKPEEWAAAFDNWLIEKLQAKDWASLFRYEELAPNARDAVPRPEHFVPLFLAAGSADPDSETKVLHHSFEFGSISYLSLQF